MWTKICPFYKNNSHNFYDSSVNLGSVSYVIVDIWSIVLKSELKKEAERGKNGFLLPFAGVQKLTFHVIHS